MHQALAHLMLVTDEMERIEDCLQEMGIFFSVDFSEPEPLAWMKTETDDFPSSTIQLHQAKRGPVTLAWSIEDLQSETEQIPERHDEESFTVGSFFLSLDVENRTYTLLELTFLPHPEPSWRLDVTRDGDLPRLTGAREIEFLKAIPGDREQMIFTEALVLIERAAIYFLVYPIPSAVVAQA